MTKSSALRFALLGAGRMGRRHAGNLATLSAGKLVWVCDVNVAAARAVADEHECRASADPEEAIASPDVDAVIVATPTETHIALCIAAARAGKPVLCEKPLDLSLERIRASRAEIASLAAPVQVGFNRRYDRGHRALANAVQAGEIGKLELCIISSRGPSGLPSKGYLEASGGFFNDAMIHDFDMIRFISGEEPVAVTAVGDALFLDDARSLGDIDTAAVTLTLASGAICQINGSRRAVIGHDQRIEAFGESGMPISQNRTDHTLERFTAEFSGARPPLIASSRDRYRQAYRDEIADFIEMVRGGRAPVVTFEDGYRASRLADAASRALRGRATIALEPPSQESSTARR